MLAPCSMYPPAAGSVGSESSSSSPEEELASPEVSTLADPVLPALAFSPLEVLKSRERIFCE
jgi:hypothetical protein